MTRVRQILLVFGLAGCLASPLAAQDYSEGFTFLKAVRERDGAKVQELVSNPSSNAINARDAKTGDSALHILVQNRNLDWLAFLLSRGARPDTQNHDGNSPLALAAQLGWVEGATQLLARKARVDLPNNRGETPLILVVQSRQLPVADRVAMIELLIGQGADPSRQDSFAGYSALDYARQESRTPDILRAMESKPAKGAGAAVVGPNP
ncbi:MAG TPA: ankyrin repeat domain-containing protein [Allosphingosinicella sp.]|nr:ankyrin repeat domain-containing protein [Allosphingosinicella sp.]